MLTLTTSKYWTKTNYLWPLLVVAIAVSVILMTLFDTGQAHAFTPNYNPSNLIDSPTLENNSTMSESAIQTFLSNVGSGLTSFSDVEACTSSISSYYSHCGQSVSAAQIIYDASQAYMINPRAILATLEKEQSLVTDPNPSASQLNCAMGYDSCGADVGFFTQVDNGAWQLEFNYQRANGNNSWWNSSLNYPCATAKSGFYNAGLIPGNTVVFNDSGGTSETVTIANAATASLYCYTPYVGPYSVTGYSGSYNFVYYYQLWFGSTQSSVAYSWVPESQNAYVDSAYSQAFTGGIYIAPGQTAYISVDARNLGYDSWTQSVVHLGTDRPMDRDSIFYNNTWLSQNRIGMQQSNVPPGSDATFQFSITAPTATGTYREYFSAVADGVTWMNDPGMYFTINVVQPQSPTNNTNTGLTTGQQINVGQYLLSPDTQSAMALESNGDFILYSDGTPVWSNGVNNSNASYIVLQSDGNLVEYDKSGNPLWGSSTTGNSGDHLAVQTDGNAVIYSLSNSAIWASATASTPGFLDKVDQSVPDGGILFPGQSLQSANDMFRLLFQTDGNLVEYDNGQAIWSSGTAGKPSSLLAMQPDGNLVIYNTSGQPIWASNTSRNGGVGLEMQSNGALDLGSSSGSILWAGNDLYSGESIDANNYTLAMQTDGNLVLYDPLGYAVWASNTPGRGDYATMQFNGALNVYNSSGGSVWNSPAGNNTAYAVVQSDGNLVIYNTSGPSWASGTRGE